MAISEFNAAINQVATERGIPVESVLKSVVSALATAYKKDRKEETGEDVELDVITVDLNPNSGEVKILRDGEDVTPSGFGRIAAQTAKQVILQKIRETEKEVIKTEFEAQIGEIATGTVFRIERGIVTLDLGRNRTQGVMPRSEQAPTENYRINQRLKIVIKDIKDTPRGTEIIVSRADPQFIRKLFEQEVPEVASGVVKIEAIAREAGSRTKMAVSSSDEKVDPVGSCVGQKGVRVQSIISELYGEKIDIVPFSEITEKFVAASLSPATVTEVELDHEEMRATVTVPEDQQSLAIGKEGQNARLANKLTRWKIDIKGAEGVFSSEDAEAGEESKVKEGKIVGVWDDAIAKTQAPKPEEKPEEKEETQEEVPSDNSSDKVSKEGEKEVAQEEQKVTEEDPSISSSVEDTSKEDSDQTQEKKDEGEKETKKPKKALKKSKSKSASKKKPTSANSAFVATPALSAGRSAKEEASADKKAKKNSKVKDA